MSGLAAQTASGRLVASLLDYINGLIEQQLSVFTQCREAVTPSAEVQVSRGEILKKCESVGCNGVK